MEDGDAGGEGAHEVHVVFDQGDGAVGGDVVEESPGRLAFGGAHSGDRLVEEEHVGVADEEHPDLQPLLLAVREDACGGRGLVVETDLLHDGDHVVGQVLAAAQEGPGRAPGSGGDVEVLRHRQVLEDRRGLEGAADAFAGDVVDLSAAQLSPVLDDGTRIAGEAGDGVDECGLPGAVGADEEVDLTAVQFEVDAVDGFEPVEVHFDAGAGECGLVHAAASARTGSFRNRLVAAAIEAIPPGSKAMTTMNSSPWA